MRRADRLDAPLTVIAGEKEMEEGKVVVRNMSDKSQVEAAITEVVDEVSSMYKSFNK